MKQLTHLLAVGLLTTHASTAAMISLYQFDGSTADSVRGQGYGGELLTGGIEQYTTGRSGQAFDFNGSTILRAPVAGAGLSNFSFSAWVQFHDTPTFATIVKNWGDTEGAYHLGLNDDATRIGSYLGGNQGVSAAFSQPISTDTWYHVGVTVGQQFQRLYIDGNLVDEVATPGILNQNFAYMSFGGKLADNQSEAASNTVGWLNGYLDDVAFFDQELSATDITAVFNAASSGAGIATLGFPGSPSISPVPEPGNCVVLTVLACSGLFMRQRRSPQPA